MSEHDHRTPAPEEDAALAHDLFLQGDLQHGTFHLACALAGDPSNQDWLSLADRYVEAADDPLALVPLKDGEKGSYFATVALRGYFLHKLGRTAEALNLLLQVDAGRPAAQFIGWTVAWLERDPAAGALIDQTLLARFLGSALSRHPGDRIEDPSLCEALLPVLRLAELTIGDPDPDTLLIFLRAALLRKTGHFDQALALARRAYEATPCYRLAGAVAHVYHARHEEEPWRAWMEIALRHEPGDIPTRNDLGDHYFDQGDLAEAERWYREILDRDAAEPWARPSYLAVRARQGDKAAADDLRAFAADHPNNERAAQLTPPGTPYVDDLPGPQEAIVNILRQLAAKAEHGEPLPAGEMKINLSGLEAPSARLALETGLADLGFHGTVRYTCSVQSPDPRLPRRRVRFQVWRYPEERQWLVRKHISTDPVPAVPPPPEELAQSLGDLARSPYSRRRWMEQARPIVTRFRPTVEDVLGVMAFPPPVPQGHAAPEWIYRVDVAAAMVLANLDQTAEAPWKTSLRRAALLDLAMGPMDWSVDAAVIALAALTEDHPEEHPEIVTEVAETLGVLLRNQPGPGYVCYEAPAVYCLKLLPGLSADLRALLADCQRQLEGES